jgi:hypothetical protein
VDWTAGAVPDAAAASVGVAAGISRLGEALGVGVGAIGDPVAPGDVT